MQGTRSVLSKNSAKISWKKKMSIRVLDEISYKEFEDTSPQEAANMVHDLFVKNIGKH